MPIHSQAISVSNAFLEKGEIVSTRGRTAEETQRFNARAGDLVKNKPVIVLINGGWASASEIVAGALQDHRRATVIGTRSFGKGSVQQPPAAASNGALRFMIYRGYFTPSGRSIQAKGISPDIEVLQEVPEALKARTDTSGEASLRGHLKAEGDEQTGSQFLYPAGFRRTTRRFTPRSISSAASRRTRPTRRTPRRRSRTRVALSPASRSCSRRASRGSGTTGDKNCRTPRRR